MARLAAPGLGGEPLWHVRGYLTIFASGQDLADKLLASGSRELPSVSFSHRFCSVAV